MSETAHLVRNAKLDDGLWNDGQGNYEGKLVHVFAPLAGVTDQTLAEIRDLYEMVGMVGQVWDNPRGVVEDLYGFYEQLSVDAVKRMVSEGIRSEIETLSTPGVQRQYKLGGYVVQAVVAIAAITKEGGELILDFAERFGQKADNIRDFVGNFTQELGERFQLLSPEQKGAFFEDFGGDGDAVDVFNDKPELVGAWEVAFNKNFPESLKRDITALEYLSSPRNTVRLDVEEALGGHSFARHGSSLPLTDMSQRVMGSHPTFPQARSALKFDNDAIHLDAVNQAFNHYKNQIRAHYASGGGYETWPAYDFGNRVGEGYHNYATLSNPTATYVTTNKVVISTKPDPSHPDGFIIDSSYPKFEPQ